MKTGASPSFRLVIVSNRGPYLLHVTEQHIRREKTIGGLVTFLLPMIEQVGGVWIAWCDPAGKYASRDRRHSFDLRYIELTPDQVKGYYQGFANNALVAGHER